MRRFADRKPDAALRRPAAARRAGPGARQPPAVLLLDEPLGALDRKLREEMQIELKLLQSQLGITFVFVTHDQGEALSMSDRIAVMRDGRIEQLADPDTDLRRARLGLRRRLHRPAELLRRPGRRRTVALVGDALDALRRRGAAGRPSRQAAGSRGGPPRVRIDLSAIARRRPTRTPSRGTLVGVSHLGETMQYLVQLGDGPEHHRAAPTPDAPALASATRVVHLDADDVLLFPADEAALRRLREPRPTTSPADRPTTEGDRMTDRRRPSTDDGRSAAPPHPRGATPRHSVASSRAAASSASRCGRRARRSLAACAPAGGGAHRPGATGGALEDKLLDLHLGRLRRPDVLDAFTAELGPNDRARLVQAPTRR